MNALYASVSRSSPLTSGIIIHALFGADPPEDSIFRSRGNAGNCGSGPFLQARKAVQAINVDDREYDLRPMLGYGKIGYPSTWAYEYVVPSINGGTIVFRRWDPARYPDGIEFEYWNEVTRSGTWMTEAHCIVDHYTGLSSLPLPTFPYDPSKALANAEECCRIIRETIQPSSSGDWYMGELRTRNVSWSSSSISFKYGELEFFQYWNDLGIYRAPHASCFSRAYVNAVDSLDLTDINTIANIGQCLDYIHAAVTFLKSPLKGLRDVAKAFREGIKTIPKHRLAGDLWLKYRYEYTTTKGDIEEYKVLVQRLKALSKLAGRKIHSTGFFSSGTGSYKAEIVLYADEVLPETVKDWLDTIGVEPNLVNLWDLVPYSFIVDWVIPISDFLDYFDNWGDTFDLNVEECWFTYMSEYDGQHTFMRVPGRKLDVVPQYIVKEASSKTIKMRVADTVSLFWR